jgi:hypothetical protein
MRKILILASLAAFAACNSAKTDETKVDSTMTSTKPDSSKMDNLAYPYSAQYSNKFEMGDPNNSLNVLKLYKDWDNNTIENSKNLFADSVLMVFSDGTMLSGSRDSVFNVVKKVRNTMGTITSDPVAWTPLKSTDKGDNWVLVWYTEHRTNPKGKIDSSYYQETWRLNKDGKVDRFYQYEQKTAPPKK